MAGIPHRIRTQRWIVRTAREEHAFALRRYLRREWESALLPAMERAFDEVDVPDRTSRFSRLEINVRVSEKDLADDLPMLIHREVVARLRDMLNWGEGTYEEPRPVPGSMISEDRFDTLLHYLRTGSLPWAASFSGDHDPAVDLRETCALELARLAGLLRAGTAHAGDMVPFLFRLLRLLSAEDVHAFVLALLEGDPAVSSAGAARAANLIAGMGGGPQSLHERLQAGAVFLAASLHGGDTAGDPYVDAARDTAPSRENQPLPPGSHGDALVSLLNLLRYVIAGDAVLSVESVPADLPGAWKNRFAGMIARAGAAGPDAAKPDDASAGGASAGAASVAGPGTPGRKFSDAVPGRHDRLRLAATLFGGCLRDTAGSVSASAGAAQLLALLVHDMAAGDARWFIQCLLENLPPAWKADAARLVEGVMEGRGISLAHDGRLRLVAALLIEMLRNAGSSAAPDLGVIHEVAGRDEAAALAAVRASIPASPLLPMSRNEDAERSPRGDGTSPGGTESRGRADWQDHDERQGWGEWWSRDERPNDEHHVRGLVTQGLEPDEGILISVHHAGLILLHPFISSFFRNTGVMEAGNRELPESSLPKAAALLHFLAAGHEELHEFELGLCKLMLGLQIDSPLPVGPGLILPGDMEEAESLLASVIEHWSILKGTPVEGFRHSFLQRRGLLRRENRGWRLQVEPAAFDMLLDHLPWGISIVRLPWMPEPIQVEWERV